MRNGSKYEDFGGIPTEIPTILPVTSHRAFNK
jgi:hypothetical protein